MKPKNRIKKLEELPQVKQPETIGVYLIFEKEGYVLHNGERITLEEYRSRPRAEEVITVHSQEEN